MTVRERRAKYQREQAEFRRQLREHKKRARERKAWEQKWAKPTTSPQIAQRSATTSAASLASLQRRLEEIEAEAARIKAEMHKHMWQDKLPRPRLERGVLLLRKGWRPWG